MSTGRTARTPRAAKGLTLHHFLLQTSLLHAYRSAVRATRPLPDPQTRRETLDYFRGDLARLKGVTELGTLQTQLSAFERSVKVLIPSLGLTGLSGHGAKLIGRGGRKAWDS